MSAGAHEMPLVKIETDSGVYGIGECHHDVTGLGAKDTVLNAFRQMLIGQDPFDIDKLTTQMMWRVSYLGGNHGVAVHAVTGIEIALWDLTGKLLDMPVRKILAGGAFTDKVRAYWTSQPRNALKPSPLPCPNSSFRHLCPLPPKRLSPTRSPSTAPGTNAPLSPAIIGNSGGAPCAFPHPNSFLLGNHPNRRGRICRAPAPPEDRHTSPSPETSVQVAKHAPPIFRADSPFRYTIKRKVSRGTASRNSDEFPDHRSRRS